MTWLTLEDAAKRVDRSVRTLYRWDDEKLISILMGRVLEADLLAADKLKRAARGRPRKPRE